MSDFTFKIVGTGVMLIIAAALVFVAKRQTVREPLTRFAIVRAGLIGTAAVYACWIAARIAQQFVIVLLVPVLFAVVLLLCARLFARVGARILARTCAVLGVLSLAVAAFLVWGWTTSEPPPPEKSAAEAAREQHLIERGNCDAGRSGACLAVGADLRDGRDMPVDAAGAVVAFERACTLRAPVGCRALAAMYDSGAGVPRDEAKAAAFNKRADELVNNPRAE